MPRTKSNINGEVQELLSIINDNEDRLKSEAIANSKAMQEEALREMAQVYERAQAAKRAGRWSQTGMLLAALGITGDENKQREVQYSMTVIGPPGHRKPRAPANRRAQSMEYIGNRMLPNGLLAPIPPAASDPAEIHRAESVAPAIKRGRGRPRKYPKLAPGQP